MRLDGLAAHTPLRSPTTLPPLSVPRRNWYLLGLTLLLAPAALGQSAQLPGEAVPPAPSPQEPAPVATVAADENGFRLGTPSEEFVLRLRGDVQADGRFFAGDDVAAGAESFYLRRVRLALQGTVFGRFDFRVMPNFGLGRAELQDAYLDARFAPTLGLRFGKFKAPVGLELLQSPTAMFFIERAYPTGLVPNRDVGVELHGDLFQKRLSYALGAFNGGLDGGSVDGDLDGGKDVMVRLFAHPFRATTSPLAGLGFGFAATAGRREGAASEAVLAGFRTSGRQTFFRYRSGEAAAQADGPHARLIPQGYYYHGPLGLMAEYALSRQEVRAGNAVATLTHRAWQVAAGYVLTGEAASFGMVRPARPLDGQARGWGALQLVGRVHGAALDEAAFPVYADPASSAQAALTWGVGLNWYLNTGVRFSVNYEQTQFDAGAGAPALEAEHVVLTRFQIAF